MRQILSLTLCAALNVPRLKARMAAALTSTTTLAVQAITVDDEFKVADLNRNGRLSKEEFSTWYLGNEL